MQVQAGALVVAVLVGVVLVPSVTEGLVLDKCQLWQQLNQTLNITMDEVKMIMCHVNVTTAFNTDVVKQIPAPEPSRPGSSSVEEDDHHDVPRSRPKPSGGRPRHRRGLDSGKSSKHSNKPDKEPSKVTAGPIPSNQTTHHDDDHNNQHIEGTHKPAASNQTGHEDDSAEHGGRKPRSPAGKTPKNDKEPSKVTPGPIPSNQTTHHDDDHNNQHIEGTHKPAASNQTGHEDDSAEHGGRKPRSPAGKTPKNDQKPDDLWTFYGLFQLSDRVACDSGKKTLNLCGLACSKLTDDDVTDDIACVGTIISKGKSLVSGLKDSDKHVKKMFDMLTQDTSCSSLVDFGC